MKLTAWAYSDKIYVVVALNNAVAPNVFFYVPKLLALMFESERMPPFGNASLTAALFKTLHFMQSWKYSRSVGVVKRPSLQWGWPRLYLSDKSERVGRTVEVLWKTRSTDSIPTSALNEALAELLCKADLLMYIAEPQYSY